MAWLEVHQELIQHPKVKRLARMLNISKFEAAGRLFAFWCWALDYADNGNLSRFDAEDIADAMEWEGDAQKLVDAMIDCGPGDSCGFIDRRDDALFVHDWDDYMGRLLSMREKNRQKQERYRERKSSEVTSRSRNRNATVTPQPDNRNVTGLPNLTVPNQTKPNLTVPNLTVPDQTEPKDKRPADGERPASGFRERNKVPDLNDDEAQAFKTVTEMYYLCPEYVPEAPKEFRFIRDLSLDYPNVPLPIEFHKARDWMSDHPDKVPKAMLSFLRRWIDKASKDYESDEPMFIPA